MKMYLSNWQRQKHLMSWNNSAVFTTVDARSSHLWFWGLEMWLQGVFQFKISNWERILICLHMCVNNLSDRHFDTILVIIILLSSKQPFNCESWMPFLHFYYVILLCWAETVLVSINMSNIFTINWLMIWLKCRWQLWLVHFLTFWLQRRLK